MSTSIKSPVNRRTGRVSKSTEVVAEAPPAVEIAPGALSSPSAADYIGRNNRTLANMRAQGRGPRFFRAGGLHSRVYYRISDLDAWLEEQVAKSNAAV